MPRFATSSYSSAHRRDVNLGFASQLYGEVGD